MSPPRTTKHPPTTWDLDLRFLTPAFVGGVEPNETRTAEIRVPAVRGALRAWYRLLVGPEIAAAGVADPEGRFRESDLFGGTARGEGQGRLSLSLKGPPIMGKEPWNPQASRGRDGPGSGRGYLGYTLRMGGNDRHALPAGTAFSLRAVHPRGLPDEEARLFMACWWLLGNLGGLGTRAQRGFGALQLNSWPPHTSTFGQGAGTLPGPGLPDLAQAKSKKELLNSLSTGLFSIWDHHRPKGPPLRLNTEFAENTPVYRLDGQSRFVIWGLDGERGWSNAWEALDAVGLKMAEFRRRFGVDGLPDATLRLLESTGTLPKAPYRATFGLPLTYRNLKTHKSFELRPMLPRSGAAARQPSPLLISFVATKAGVFALLTRLSGHLPGRDVDLVVKGKEKERGFIPTYDPSPTPGRAPALDDFLDTLNGRKEVRL